MNVLDFDVNPYLPSGARDLAPKEYMGYPSYKVWMKPVGILRHKKWVHELSWKRFLRSVGFLEVIMSRYSYS